MTSPGTKNIAHVDQVDDKVVIEFNDDVTAVYSADLLLSVLPQAKIATANPDLDAVDSDPQGTSEPGQTPLAASAG